MGIEASGALCRCMPEFLCFFLFCMSQHSRKVGSFDLVDFPLVLLSRLPAGYRVCKRRWKRKKAVGTFFTVPRLHLGTQRYHLSIFKDLRAQQGREGR